MSKMGFPYEVRKGTVSELVGKYVALKNALADVESAMSDITDMLFGPRHKHSHELLQKEKERLEAELHSLLNRKVAIISD